MEGIDVELLYVIGTILFLCAAKIVDNMLGTSKTILIQKNRAFLASLSVVVSQVIFYELIEVIGDSDSKIVMYAVSVASGIGTYLAVMINNRFSKDRLYVHTVLSDNIEGIKSLRDYLMEHKITNVVTDGYTKDWEKTLAITVYAETKEDSKLLDKFLYNSEIKHKIITNKM